MLRYMYTACLVLLLLCYVTCTLPVLYYCCYVTLYVHCLSCTIVVMLRYMYTACLVVLLYVYLLLLYAALTIVTVVPKHVAEE